MVAGHGVNSVAVLNNRARHIAVLGDRNRASNIAILSDRAGNIAVGCSGTQIAVMLLRIHGLVRRRLRCREVHTAVARSGASGASIAGSLLVSVFGAQIASVFSTTQIASVFSTAQIASVLCTTGGGWLDVQIYRETCLINAISQFKRTTQLQNKLKLYTHPDSVARFRCSAKSSRELYSGLA